MTFLLWIWSGGENDLTLIYLKTLIIVRIMHF